MGHRWKRQEQIRKDHLAAGLRHFLRSLHGKSGFAAAVAEWFYPAAISDPESTILRSEPDHLADKSSLSNNGHVHAIDLRTESQSAHSVHDADWRDARTPAFKIRKPFRYVFEFPGQPSVLFEFHQCACG